MRKKRSRRRRKETVNNTSFYKGIWHGAFSDSKLKA
jgi:hypothetical protein